MEQKPQKQRSIGVAKTGILSHLPAYDSRIKRNRTVCKRAQSRLIPLNYSTMSYSQLSDAHSVPRCFEAPVLNGFGEQMRSKPHFLCGATKVFAGAMLLVVAGRKHVLKGAGQCEPCSGSTA